MRVVLDTNVLVRAFCSPFGPAKELLQLVTAPPHDLVLSPFVIAELHRVMRYDRVRALHQRDDSWINTRIADLQSTAILMSPMQAPQTKCTRREILAVYGVISRIKVTKWAQVSLRFNIAL